MLISKYNASGNDFVLFHTFLKKDYSSLAKKLCNRFEGVGADGLIVLIPHKEYDFEWLFYNSDGSEASMCGNGSRACAHYAYTNYLANENMTFLTQAGSISCEVYESTVQTQLSQHSLIKHTFEQEGFSWQLFDTGVPHLVTLVDDIQSFDKDIAKKMRNQYNANVNFSSIQDKKLFVRTYERGVEDETGACGTGMAAAFLSAFNKKLLSSKVSVFPTSHQELSLHIKDNTLFLTGSVNKVFEVALCV